MGTHIRVGPASLEILDGHDFLSDQPGPGLTSISLRMEALPDQIKKIHFLNDKGAEIPCLPKGPGSYFMGDVTRVDEHSYRFHERIDHFDIKVDYYDHIETRRVPLSIKNGVGF